VLLRFLTDQPGLLFSQSGHVSIAEMLQELGFSGEAELSRPRPNGGDTLRLGRHSIGGQSAEASTDCRRRGVGDLSWGGLGFLKLYTSQRATSPNQNALSPALERQWQGDGIHRHAVGMFYTHFVSSLPIGPPPFFISDRKLKICLIFVATHGDLLPAAQLNVKRYMYK
jgi:hypothetical protein